jgi:hypothetical protein
MKLPIRRDASVMGGCGRSEVRTLSATWNAAGFDFWKRSVGSLSMSALGQKQTSDSAFFDVRFSLKSGH